MLTVLNVALLCVNVWLYYLANRMRNMAWEQFQMAERMIDSIEKDRNDGLSNEPTPPRV